MRYKALQQKIWTAIRHNGTDMNTIRYTLKWLDDHPEEAPARVFTRVQNEAAARAYLDSNSWSAFRKVLGIEVEQPSLPTEPGSVVTSDNQTFVLGKDGQWRSGDWFIGGEGLISDGFTVDVS